eukprot:1149422-Pelagomonas_calceolata.AAC.13
MLELYNEQLQVGLPRLHHGTRQSKCLPIVLLPWTQDLLASPAQQQQQTLTLVDDPQQGIRVHGLTGVMLSARYQGAWPHRCDALSQVLGKHVFSETASMHFLRRLLALGQVLAKPWHPLAHTSAQRDANLSLLAM